MVPRSRHHRALGVAGNGRAVFFASFACGALEIAARALLIQTGKKDGIGWWPQVVDEFEASREHYRKLGIPGHIEMDLHDGGHEIRVESGLPFLKKWLSQ